MTRYDASNAECLVYTYKEGLLSKVAHDLKLHATSFEIDVDDAFKAISAGIDSRSLRVMCSMSKGEEKPDVLADKDKQDIEKNIIDKVLHASEHPRISFNSSSVTESASGYEIAGTMKLHGTEKPITATAVREGDRFVVEFTIHQPDFGIKPFSAMLGTLKVKPDVKLRLSLAA